MIEDDVYRTSTQYRYWSYTPQQLVELRRQTNELASEKVRAAFRRAHRSRNGAGTQEGGDEVEDDAEIEVATLTVEEELKIVEWGCRKIVEMGEAMRPRIPGGVVVCLCPTCLRHTRSHTTPTRSQHLIYRLCEYESG